MRKNSKQILREIKLDEELKKFPERQKLLDALDALENFKLDEYEGLMQALEITKDNDILHKFATDRILAYWEKLRSILGVTIEGFKTEIERLEKKRSEYEQIRNNAKQQVDNEFKGTVH